MHVVVPCGRQVSSPDAPTYVSPFPQDILIQIGGQYDVP